MDCSQFQDKLDLYLDGLLDDPSVSLAARHLLGCNACESVVTEHKKARALLITAVADKAAAVDVSGLWSEIEARLDAPGVLSLAAARTRRALRAGSRTPRMRTLGFAALTTAAAAAAVVFALANGRTADGTRSPTSFAARTFAQSRPVRIDSMEVGAGHTVSTWIRPRTKTRIIWVASTGSGFDMTPAAAGAR